MALRKFQEEQSEFWDLFQISWEGAEEGLESILAKVTKHCADCFAASGASLFLNSGGEADFHLVARSGTDVNIPENTHLRPGEGIAGACLELGRPLVVCDPKEHPLLLQRGVRRRRDIGSAMVIPLLSHGDPIGVMNLSRPSDAPAFSQKDLVRAESVVRHIALAIENARLFSEVTKAAKEARRLQTRLLEIIHSVGIAIIVVDSEEHVTEANKAALTLLGRESENTEYAGLLARILEALHQAVAGETVKTRIHLESSNRSWSLICLPLKSGGATAAIEEITEHENAEREMSRLHRMAEIGQMTAALAHEIRNPLTSIAAAGALVQDVPEKSSELGQMITEEALKLNGLCDQFLDFARPTTIKREDVRLDAIAKHLSKQHSQEFKDAKVKLELKFEPGSPIIQGDPLKLEQVMRNLMLNALQACSGKGRVCLRVWADGFSVEDNGEGMSEETLGKLFTPFFTTKSKGTGLGLSNVRKIVEAHGGKVNVVSKVGKGSLFTVRLKESNS
jgi:signal transduction histidine kinase